MYAHFTNARKGQLATLRITRDVAGREVVTVLGVTGKREANAKARELNAQPWNF